MVAIKKIGDEYFLCKRKIGLYRGSHNIQEKFTNKFRVISGWYKKGGRLSLNCKGTITVPEELVGKKIILKVVIVEDIKLGNILPKPKKEFKFEELELIHV